MSKGEGAKPRKPGPIKMKHWPVYCKDMSSDGNTFEVEATVSPYQLRRFAAWLVKNAAWAERQKGKRK